MKIADINETMYTGTMNDMSAAFKYVEKTFFHQMEHIGDIENYKVYHTRNDNTNIYGILLNDELIGFASTATGGMGTELENIYLIPSHRGKGLFPMFLIFLKRIEKVSKIMLGAYHSDDAIAAIEKIYHRFNTYWLNSNGDTIPYTLDNSRAMYTYGEPNSWRLILEGDTSSQWPRYFMEDVLTKWPIESMYYHTLLNGKDK